MRRQGNAQAAKTLCMWCAWLGCWRGAFGVCIRFLSLIGVTVQVLGAPRHLLHPELTKHAFFAFFVIDPVLSSKIAS
jgi:hypothetical protein